MQNAHAILGPSSASKWLTCPPSARFEQQQPNEDTFFSKEGTLAHEVAALILAARAGIYQGTHQQWLYDLDGLEMQVDKFYEQNDKPTEFQSMLDHAEDYAKFVCELSPVDGDISIGAEYYEANFDDIAKRILIESKYDVFDYVPLGFGTSDATILTKRVLIVGDYKYGAGVRVSAVDNSQMKLYGLGALSKAIAAGIKTVETVVLAIFQPRVGGASTWQIDAKELLEWGEEVVKPKALQAIAGIGEFKAGKHCQFCKASTVCKAFYDRFADVQKISDKRAISDAELSKVLTFGPAVSSWVKKMEEEAVKKMERGNKIKGFKLVKGRGRRSFGSEDDVVDALIGAGFESYEIFDPKLRSLTDLEKHLGKNKFNQLLGSGIITVEGKPSIAPETDDRPAVSASGADEYDDDNYEDLI